MYNSKEIYESKIRETLTYAFLYNGKVIHIRKDNFEFLSGFKPNDYQVKQLRYGSIKVKSFGNLLFNKF